MEGVGDVRVLRGTMGCGAGPELRGGQARALALGAPFTFPKHSNIFKGDRNVYRFERRNNG